MRYLVTARLQGRVGPRALARHHHAHAWARLGRRRRVPPQHGRSASAARRSSGVGGDVLLRDASRRGTPVLAGVLRSAQREGRTRPQPVPSRNRGRALGVLELRLYGPARGRVGAARDAIRAWRVASRGVVARRHRPAGSRGGPDAFACAARRALVLRRVLRFIQPPITAATNRIPFAVFDLVLVALVVAVLAIVWIVARSWSRGRWRAVGQGVSAIAVLAAGLFLWFWVVWGLNYRRVPIDERLARVTSTRQDDAVLALATRAVSEANALHPGAHAAGFVDAPERDAQFREAFSATLTALGHTSPVEPGRLKRTVVGPYFRWAGVDGMISPFTLGGAGQPRSAAVRAALRRRRTSGGIWPGSATRPRRASSGG